MYLKLFISIILKNNKGVFSLLLVLLNILFAEMTFARCSKDQVEILVNAVLDSKSPEWQASNFVRKEDLISFTHNLLFNQIEKIPGDQRSERSKEQITLLFEKINELSSFKNSENISEFLSQIDLLERFFQKRKSISTKSKRGFFKREKVYQRNRS